MISAQSSINNRLCKDHAQRMGMSRFLHNDRVPLATLGSGITQSWYNGSFQDKDLFIIQDTSDINAIRHKGRIDASDPDLGPLWGKNAFREYGFFLHPSLVLEAGSGFPLGFSDIFIWNRQAKSPDRHERNYKRQPIEQKSSYRWLAGVKHTQKLLFSHQARRYHIMDREADIYELFVAYQFCEQDHLIVRMNRDRLIYANQQQTPRHLHEYLDEKSDGIVFELELPRAGKRKARTARMELFYERVEMKRPKDRTKTQGPDRLPAWIVHVREMSAGLPKEQIPVKWTIWTTCPVESMEQSLWIIEAYKKRWVIEELFSLLKTKALEIESAQVESGMALKRLTLIACQAALIILQLIKDRDHQHKQSVDLVLDAQQTSLAELINKSIEGQTLKQQNPYPEKSLARLAWTVARLGGYSGYTSQSAAGPKTMSIGWRRFNDMLNALQIDQKFNSS